MLFSIQILIKKVLKHCFFEFFLHEVIAELVLPQKYLPELEKNIFYVYFQHSMYAFFPQFLNALKILGFSILYSK